MAWVSPRTWVAAEVVTASNMNGLRDSLKAIGDAWTAYTPAWTTTGTAPVLGNGTITGFYMSAGKLTQYKIRLTMGSTTTYGTGSFTFSLPVSGSVASYDPMGSAVLHDASAGARYLCIPWVVSGTTIRLLDQAQTGASPEVAQTSPITFATSDEIHIGGWYEAA